MINNICTFIILFNHTLFFHQHVSVTPVAIIRMSYNKNIINIQIILQKGMIKPLDITLDNNT